MERLFALFDTDGSGELDFMEFTAGIWNICTMDDVAIARFCFSLVGSESDVRPGGDRDKWTGVEEPPALTLPQCDALYRMLTEDSTKKSSGQGVEPLAVADFV